MPKGFSPEELQRFGVELLAQARERRPADVNEEDPDSVKAFKGNFWEMSGMAQARPDENCTVNIVYSAWKSLLPQVLANLPKPMAAPVRPDAAGLAEAVNKLKDYRDRETYAREVYRRVFLDAFLRGTGFLRHRWDADRGIAVSEYFPSQRVFLDHNATSIKDAKHVIEEHEVYRWEFAQRFGPEIADEIPTDKHVVAGVTVPSPFDRIKYHLLWSKHEGYDRVYAFHETYGARFLNEGPDGQPGEPFPFTLDKDEWHLTPLILQGLDDHPWGISYYQTASGPIRFIQFATSYLLSAAGTSCKQLILFPNKLQDLMHKIADVKKHLVAVGYDDADFQQGIERMIHMLEFPQLPRQLIDANTYAWSMHDKVTGFNAVVQGDPGGVETASESMRMSEYAENRVGDDRKAIEEWLIKAWRKEIQIDGKFMKRQSVVRINGVTRPDVPYAQAVMLVRGVGDPATAQRELMAAQQLQQSQAMDAQGQAQAQEAENQQAMAEGRPAGPAPWPPPLQVEPEIAVRQEMGVPLESPVEIVQPGLEAFIGPELAQFWIENLSPDEIRHELVMRIEQGSTRKLNRIQEVNEAQNLAKSLLPFYMQNFLFPQAAELVNFLLARHESFHTDNMRVTPEQLQQGTMMQMQMQQAQAASAPAGEKPDDRQRDRERGPIQQANDQQRQAAGVTGNGRF